MRPGLNAVYHSFSLFNRDFSVRAVRVSELVQILSPACRVANAVENEHLDFARKLQGVDDQRISDVYKGFVSSFVLFREYMDKVLPSASPKGVKGGGVEGAADSGPAYAVDEDDEDNEDAGVRAFIW